MNPPVNTASESPGRLFRRSSLVLLSSVLISTSCSDGAGSAPGGALESWRLSDDPIVVIGGADEREGYLLHQVIGATRLGDGRIVIANGSTLQLRYYDPQGNHLFDAGGKGEGPGEFQTLDHVTRLPGDSVVALSRARQLVRFGPDGRYAGSSPYEPSPCQGCMCHDGFLVPDGSLLLVYSLYAGGLQSRDCLIPSELRPTAVIGRFDPATGVLDTIAELPGAELSYLVEGRMFAYPGNLVHGIAPDRVYLGDTESDVILEMSFRGDTIATLPVPFDPAPVSADARQQPDEPESRWTYTYPDRYPRYARLVAAPGERVWVMAYPHAREPMLIHGYLVSPTLFRRFEDGGALWRVVARDGVSVAELRTPEGFFLLEVGAGYILGTHKDEFDRESVQLYRLMR